MQTFLYNKVLDNRRNKVVKCTIVGEKDECNLNAIEVYSVKCITGGVKIFLFINNYAAGLLKLKQIINISVVL